MSRFENETIGSELTEAKPRTILGIIGALVGALLGAAIWVGLYQLGVIAGFAGIAIIFFACSGYALLSRSKALKGVVVSIVISVLVLLAAHIFCWGLDIFYVLSEEYEITLMEAILEVPSIAFTSEYVIDFVKELLIGLVLIGVGSARFIYRARHNQTERDNDNT